MTSYAYKELQETLGRDLVAFLPELVLCGAIVLMLLVRLFPRFDHKNLGWVALVLTVYALFVSVAQWLGWDPYDPRSSPGSGSIEIFSGLLVYDNFTIFLRLFLFSFAALTIWLSLMTGIPDVEDSADFFSLLLGATVGMALMAQANHLMMIFIGIEMASLPSYALAGFLKGRRRSSEAALKYVVYGGGSAGIMLYGISLIAGKYGTGYLPDLVGFMAAGPVDLIIVLGSLFILVGVAFKLAAVPFHFWCPDVFEGAAAEVAAFLSVASKGAALALLGRLALGLGGLGGIHADVYAAWENATPYLVPTLAVFAVITVTFGNLAAYAQTNLKRLLAYSTIAHAGFMMMGFATMTREGAAAVLFYLIVYLFMNLGAFAVVAFLRNLTGSEDLRDFRGLVQRAPALVVTLGIFLLSLLGMPPLAGFVAKFQIVSVIFDAAGQYTSVGQPGLAWTMYALLVIGLLNTVLSLVYYVKVLKVMTIDKPLEEVEGRPAATLDVPWLPNLYAGLLAAVIFVLGIFWNPLSAGSDKGVSSLHDAARRGLRHARRAGAVIDAQTQAILTAIVRRQGRALLTYVRDAFPWTTLQDGHALERLKAIVQEEEEATARVGRFLVRHKCLLPYLGAYPMSFTTINFVSLQHLVPLLVEDGRRAIAEMEDGLRRIHDPAARVPVQELLNLKRKHVDDLQALHQPATPATPATAAAAH